MDPSYKQRLIVFLLFVSLKIKEAKNVSNWVSLFMCFFSQWPEELLIDLHHMTDNWSNYTPVKFHDYTFQTDRRGENNTLHYCFTLTCELKKKRGGNWGAPFDFLPRQFFKIIDKNQSTNRHML